LLIKLNQLRKPTDVRRIPTSDIISINLRQGILSDRLQVSFRENQRLDLEVNRGFRDQSRAFVSVFNSHRISDMQIDR
jgi:hypothetical protein